MTTAHIHLTLPTGVPVRLHPIDKLALLMVGDTVTIHADSLDELRRFLRAALTEVDGANAVAEAMTDAAVLTDCERSNAA